MKLMDLFITSSIPVVKILLITGVGSYLALDRVGILGPDARKHLNNVVFYVFRPSHVCSSLVETIMYESMLKMWFLPVNVLLTFIIGTFLGWIIIQFTKPPSHLRGLILGCCAAGNLGNLPLIIIPAICKEQGSPFGDPDSCEKYGRGSVSLSMALGAFFIWTYVYNLMRVSTAGGKETRTSTPSVETNRESCAEPLISPKEEADDCASPSSRPEAGTWDKIKQGVSSLAGKIHLGTIFAPSTAAAIIAFVIRLIPQVRKLLIDRGAPLYVIKDSVSLVGDGAIPAITLIVGGNLLRDPRNSGTSCPTNSETPGPTNSETLKSIVVGIIVARYIMLPIIGVLVVRGAFLLGVVSSEPLYQFVLLLQFVVPPTMNVGTITQFFGKGERECSVILLWTCVLASIALTVWSTFFMWLVG